MFEHKAFVRFVDKSHTKGHDIVCLTIVKTQGSTYQKPGTTMLVNSAHEMVGVLSGGCIEEALMHCCDEVLKTGNGKLVTHDLRLPDDSQESWETGVGCNGLIQVWLEPFYFKNDYALLGKALSFSKQGMQMTWHRSLKEEGNTSSSLSTNKLDTRVSFDEASQMMLHSVFPTFKVLVLGIGEGVQAFVDMSNVLGWQTHICDTRQDGLTLIKHADQRVFFSTFHDCETLIQNERFDACVIMSHDFKADSFYLKTAMHSNMTYIGLLGSKERTRKILEFLGDGVVLDERFHAPIGLSIGAKIPQAIALSICAQIEAVKNQKE